MITFGTDIEFCLVDKNDNPQNAIPYIRGTKNDPQFVEGGNIQKDNVAFEIAINYSADPEVVLYNFKNVLINCYGLIPDGWNLSPIPSIIFPEDQLIYEGSDEFGCSPDFDAKTGDVNIITRKNINPNFRTFGLHIHTGFYNKDVNSVTQIEHILKSDYVLGLLSTIIDNSEASISRRQLYGAPSCYRPTEYGVEYRTLSNFWAITPYHLRLIIELNKFTYDYSINDYLEEYDVFDISDIIMKGDKEKAINIFYKSIYPELPNNVKHLYEKVLTYTQIKSLQEEWSIITQQTVKEMYK